MQPWTIRTVAAALLLTTSTLRAVTVSPEELTAASSWTLSRFGKADENSAPTVPFSFTVNGKSSAELLKQWPLEHSSRTFLPSQAGLHPRGVDLTEHTLKWTDAATGLEVRCVIVEYRNFPTVEWCTPDQGGAGVDPVQAHGPPLHSGSSPRRWCFFTGRSSSLEWSHSGKAPEGWCTSNPGAPSLLPITRERLGVRR
jgi:hypothetical protein